jgi:hypothetical protein
MAGATVVRLTYGYTPKDEEDEYIGIAERAMDSFSLLTTPGMFMVDIFPFRTFIHTAISVPAGLMAQYSEIHSFGAVQANSPTMADVPVRARQSPYEICA